VGDALFLEHGVHFLRPVHVEDVVGAKGAIHEKLAAPVAVVVLEAEEISLRAADGAGERVGVGGIA
jgi:hypothetical protein